MAKLRTLGPRVRAVDTSTVRLPPKQLDQRYNTPEFRWWRAEVVRRAGGRCEAIVDGYRCSKAYPHHRMYADHVVELSDGGALSNINNGMCLCASHHEIKTVEARKLRQRMKVE